jgi:DNA-nicking Smr family endonuclease
MNNDDLDSWLEEIADVKPMGSSYKQSKTISSNLKVEKPAFNQQIKQTKQGLIIDIMAVESPIINFKTPHYLPYDKPPPTLQLNRIDATLLRHLKLNRDIIQHKIDLHDMSLSEAYYALRNFLQQAVMHESKIVLIITGKGSKGGIGELRRNLPRWCIEPNFGNIVVGLQPAYKHHGGDGAFYLQLKKR